MKKQITKNIGFTIIALVASLFMLNSCDDDEGGVSSEQLEDIIVQIEADKGFAIMGESLDFKLSADSLASTISSYAWTFEGGSPESSTEAAPTVTFNSEGTFQASLTVVRTSDNKEFSGVFDVLVLEKANTAFMADFTSIEQGGQVVFRSMSSSDDNLVWTFEGGDPETSTEPEVVVTYANNGTYDVSLTSTLNGDQATSTETDYIEVTAQAAPTFTSTTTTIEQRESVTYTNTTPTVDGTIAWTFTGGDITSSTDNEVTVTYPQPGTFDVALAITKNGITNTLEETGFVTVEAADATLQSAETNLSGSLVILTYDFPLNDPSTENITVLVDGMNATVSSKDLDNADDTKINLTLATPLAAGSVVTATYTSPTITTTVGGAVLGFTNEAVTNNTVAGPAEFGVDIPSATAGSSYVSLAGTDGATASNNGVTFTLNGPIAGTRTRGGVTQEPIDLHEDFVFTNANTTMTLTISGLTGGQEYTINSVHFEGLPAFPARMSVSLKDGAGATVAGPQIIDNNPAADPFNGGPGPVDNISTTNFTFTAQAGTDYVIESVGQVAVVPDPAGGQGAGQNRNRFNAVLVTEGSTSSLTPPVNLFSTGGFEGVTTDQYDVNNNFLGSGNRGAIAADFVDGAGVGGSRALVYTITGGASADSRVLFGDKDAANVQLITPVVSDRTYTVKAMIKFTGERPTSFDFGIINFPFVGNTSSFVTNMDLSDVNAGDDFVEVEGTLTTRNGIGPNAYAIPRLFAGNGDSVITIDNIQVFEN